MVYVMFVLLSKWGYKAGGPATFQFEFKDKIQCENALSTMQKRFIHNDRHTPTPDGLIRKDNFTGYCQEVRK